MARKDRRSKLRALAAAASLLGAAAMGGAMGLFDTGGGSRILSTQGQVDASNEGLHRTDNPSSPAGDAHEEQHNPQRHPPLRRTTAVAGAAGAPTPHEQIVAAAAAAKSPPSEPSSSSAVDPSDPYRNCVIRPATLANADLRTPVLAASYPGSGSRMVRHLIEALTGVATGDEWYRNTRRAVAIKTHYPHNHGSDLNFGWADEIRGAILLIRNPRDAIPSFCNHLYERKNGMTDHSTRAPVEYWVQWRNREFKKQLAWWKDTIVHWVERFPADQRLVLTYEGVTGKLPPTSKLLPGSRVESTRKLASFLAKSVEGLNIVPQKEMNCVWYKVVKYDEAEHEEGGVTFNSQRVDHPDGGSARPYTKVQLEEMLQVFRQIKNKFPKEADVVEVMEAYKEEVTRNLHIHNIAAAQKAAAQEQPAGDIAAAQKAGAQEPPAGGNAADGNAADGKR